MTRKEDIITIDGPSGVGKSTVAKTLARRLGFRYLDTGAMYRAATLAALRAGLKMDPPDEKEVEILLRNIRLELDGEGCVLLDGDKVHEHIREDRVTEAVSAVSTLRTVRSHLQNLQRKFAQGGSVVAEGRDLGSVVFPDATHKFYLDADPKIRARRRARQDRISKEERVTEKDVLKAQERRDRLDSDRSVSPLVLSPDMIQVDTTSLSVEEVVEKILMEIHGCDP